MDCAGVHPTVADDLNVMNKGRAVTVCMSLQAGSKKMGFRCDSEGQRLRTVSSSPSEF